MIAFTVLQSLWSYIQQFFRTHLELFQSNIPLVPIDMYRWILHGFQVLMMTYGQPTTIFIFKFVRFVSDGFLFDLEACLINLKLPPKLLICSVVLKGDFVGLERFRWLMSPED